MLQIALDGSQAKTIKKKLLNQNKSTNIWSKIGRARRGVSGTLYSQSAIARLNSFPRVD